MSIDLLDAIVPLTNGASRAPTSLLRDRPPTLDPPPAPWETGIYEKDRGEGRDSVRVVVRAKEPFTVVMNHVRWVISAPNFGLPRDLINVLSKFSTVGET